MPPRGVIPVDTSPRLDRPRTGHQTLADLPLAVVATDAEVLGFIEHRTLFRHGVGYVDVHRLANTRLMAGATVWTHDNRPHGLAARLGLAGVG